jgi:kynurenine 3-monooxygenase
VLLGDAAHTLVPFFWQSVNFAFNDCIVLDSCIDKYGLDKAFEMYSK